MPRAVVRLVPEFYTAAAPRQLSAARFPHTFCVYGTIYDPMRRLAEIPMSTGGMTVSAAIGWCQRARELLGIFRGRRHGNRMDDAIKDIRSDLKEVARAIERLSEGEAKTGWTQKYESAQRELLEIAQLAKSAVETESNETAQEASNRLVVLQHTIKTTFYPESQESAKNLLDAKERMVAQAERYRERYESYLAAAETRRKELFTFNRPKQSDNYDGPLKALIARAIAFADEHKYSEAIAVLDKSEVTFETQRQLASKDRILSMNQARDQPVYNSQRNVIIAGLEKIQDLPGAGPQKSALERALREAEVLAKEPQFKYREAFNKLKQTEQLIDQATTASKQFGSNVDQLLNGKYSAAQSKITEFSQLVGLAEPEQVQKFSQQLNDALREMDQDTADSNYVGSLLDSLVFAIESQIRSARESKATFERRLPEAKLLLETVTQRAILTDFQPVLTLFRMANAEFAAQQFPSAVTNLEEMIRQATEVRDRVQVHYEHWNRLLVEITEDYLEHLEQAASLELAELRGAGSLLASFIGARDYYANQQHDFPRAIEIAEAVTDKVGSDDSQGYRKVLADYAGLQPKREEAQQALEPVSQELETLRSAGGDAQVFANRLARLSVDWNSTCNGTIDTATIDQALVELKLGLDELLRDIQSVTQDPTNLEESIGAAQSKQQASQFAAKKGEVEKLIRYLSQEYPGEVADFQQRLGSAERLVENQPERALEDVSALAVDVQAKVDEKKREVDTLRRQALDLGNTYLSGIENLKKEKGFSNLARALEPLSRQVTSLIGLADSSLLVMVQQGRDELTRFQTEYDRQMEELRKIPIKLTELATLLNQSDLTKHMPQKRSLLQARLKQEIPGRCAEDPEEALDPVLKDFEAEINLAIEASQVAARELELIKQLAGVLNDEIDKLVDAPTLQQSFRARVDRAKTPAEGQATSALQDLQRLQLMIAATLAKPELLAGMEQGALQEQFESEQAENNWQAQVEIFKLREQKAASDQHSRLRELLGISDKNEQLYKEMQTAFSDAENLAKAGEYTRALDQLARARRLAQQYADNPDSAQISSKRNMDKVVQGWQSAAAKFISDMRVLADTIVQKCKLDPAYEEQAEAIVMPLRQLAVSFDGRAFDDAVNRLANASELAERRSAKEEGLRHLRRFQDVMNSDPVFAMLNNNPFAAVAVKPLIKQARDLDANLRRS